eukprot:125782-Rhodomonas_salina.1
MARLLDEKQENARGRNEKKKRKKGEKKKEKREENALVLSPYNKDLASRGRDHCFHMLLVAPYAPSVPVRASGSSTGG